MSTAKHTPGPWRPSHWSGGEGYPAGWYVERSNNGRTDWLRDATGLRRFSSKESAQAGIDQLAADAALAKATGEKQ